MITGGLGGVGLALARWLLSQYAARVVLVDRYSPERLKAGGELSLERLTEFESLADLPGEVIYLQADCANYDQVYQAVSAGMHHFGKPFDGVFHLAGRYGEGVIAETPVAEFHALCESKCVGGFTLDKVFREIGQSSSDSLAPLLFINFSSLVALFGGATIAAYAASNSFLEGFTHYQNSLPSHGRSIRSVCLVSSNWNDTGMSQGYQMKSLSRERGFHFMTPEQGIVSVKAMVESGKSVSVFGLNPYKPAVRPYLIGGTLQSQALYGFYQMNAFSDSSLADLERIDLRDALDKRCSIDYVPVPSIPLTDEGEVNFVSLQEMVSGQLMGHKPKVAPRNTTETRIAEICARVLQLEEVGVKDNFFDIGANSMLIARIHNEIQNSLAIQFPMIELFNSTTIEKLAGFVDAMQTGVPDEGLEAARKMGEKRRESRLKHAFEGAEADAIDDAVAIIGLAGRLPMSDNMDQLWENLIGGKDCITRFTPEQLLELGVDPEMIARPDYVPAAGYIWNQDKFDALFFEINPKEAAGIDPQHRMGLEVAWEALEDSGYTSQSVKGDIGVFAGVNISHYLFEVLNASQPGSANAMELLIGGDKDHFGSRIAYKFDLRGPCVSMGTACSTTLVTTHFACQSLMAHECRLALTGGAHLFLPNGIGHVYHEGSYASSDTYCRPFDARSNGIIISNGVCFAVLKRLKDAIEDRDSIYAVIKGTAINNDGMDKIGYTAPSVSGQTRMIVDALTASQIPPESIRFVEAHGTGTQLGDPIEVSALTRAYRMQTDKVGYCGLGSIKSNMGHVGAVAGIAGMAKAALALKHRLLPPTIHFETPNPKLELDTSPFYVVAQAEPLERGAYPLRAAVSALGIGGTNAHVILEEPPEEVVSSESRDWQLLLLSAKNPASLDRMTENLSEWLTRHPQSNLADVAYTLQVGRVPFACKRGFVVQKGDMQAIASEIAPAKGFSGRSTEPPRQVVFMFPGGGTQYVLMAKGVYDSEPSFAQDMDRCAELIQHASGLDLFSLIYPQAGQMEEAEQRLQIPKHFFVALFAVEYSLARLWMSWGVKPTAVVGHSLGEYIAATIAGVFSLEEAIALVCFRGELFEKLEKGQMFSVTASAEAVSEWLIEGVSIATINNDQQCVVAGRFEPMEVFAEKLTRQGIEFRKLPIDTAGHSPMVDPILEEFGQFLSGITFHQPDIPLISNMSGEWVQSQEITTPDYWKRHLRQTVRFVDGVKTLLNEPNTLFLEVGAGRTLSSFVRAQLTPASRVSLFSSLRHAQDDRADMSHLLETLGKIWMTGKEIDWQALYMDERRQRISLPTYAFDRRRYWIEAKSPVSARQQERLPIDQWLWQPVWQLQERPATDHAEKSLDPVLLFSDGGGLCHALSDLLKQAGSQVVAVEKGSQFSTQSGGTMTIHPTTLKDYHALVSSLKQNARFPSTLVYAWSLETSQEDEVNQVNSLLALVYLAKALVARESEEPVRIVVLTCQREAVMPNDSLVCAQSLITGPVNVIPFEHPSIRILTLDLHASDVDDPAMARTVSEELYRYQQLTDEEWVGTPNALAIRSGARFVRDYTRLPTSSRAADEVAIAAQSVWVVTGGLGGVGMVHAQTLAPFGVKIALLQRSSFPDPDHWDAILKTESDGTLEQALMKNRIETLKRIQEQGSEVCIFKGDINQPENLRRCLQEVRATFGPITGVMHCAGFGDHVSTLETTPAILASVLAPKVTGTNRLLEMLHEDPLDYVVLCSSMSVQTTGYGLVGYIGACAYLDAVAHQHRKNRQTRFVSVNWDIWDTEQRGIRRKLDPAITTQAKEDRPLVRPHEGADILLRALVAHTPQVVVATANLHDILIKNRKIGTLLAQREDSVEQEGDQSDRENSGFFERPTLSSDYAAPETEAETILVAIWQEAFGVAPIGIHDNFFELGGESLLGVKIIASARQKGLVIDPKKMFTHPTIAQVVSGLSLSQPVQSQHQTVSGSYPCSPVQLDFLERKWVNPVHWNVGVMLPLDRHLSDEAMSSLVSTLLERHAVLRSCFRQEGERWIQFYQEVNARLYWEGHDLTHLSSSMVSHEVETVCIQAQSSFNLTSGPLFKLVVFRLPEGKPDRLALLAHHLVIDALSVSILLDEIARILEDEKSLPAPTVPYPVYVEKLTQQVHSEAMRAECEFWKQIVEEWKGHSVKLPVDREQGDATEKTSALVSIELDEAQTAVLTRAVPEQTGMSLAELVLAGWASCLAHWQGCPRIMVDMVNHGRSVLPDLDVSRTVGWFGQGGTYPLQVDSLPLTQHWREIKAQIQRVPHHGLGLSWIKTLHDDTGIRECLSLLPEAECSLNYLGNAGQMSASSHALIHDAMGALCDPDNPRRYRHQLLVSIRHARLILQWNYSQARYRTETIEQQMALLKKRLLEWVEEVSNTELMGSGSSRSSEHAFESALSALTPPLSPSLPSASIAPVASTVVTGVLSVPRISPSQSEEQYGLTPLQREIWVRYTDQTTPVSNVIQILAEYEGLYDDTGGQQGLSYETSSQPMVKGITRSLLEWVWNTLVARHPVFRTVFVETDVGTGAHAGGVSQVVLKEAALSMIEKDMTHLAPAEQAEALQALLDSDRHERYDLSRAPAMRLYWVNLCRKTGRVAILQSNHQILLDGWSSMLVMKDFVGCLIARLHGSTPAELSSECRFGNYLNWLEAQDTSGCLGYWKQRFEGYSHQDPLRELIQHRPSGGYATQETYLDSGRMEKIKQTARATQTTSNAVFQAAWVMMLAKIGQLHDLVYGVTVSGRASQCDGIDSIVGQCTNSLPVRMTLETAMRVSDLIQKVHAANHDAQAHNVVSLGDIEQALGMSGGLGRLYSSNIIFESLPSLEAEIPEGMALIKVLNSHWTDSWHFPLRLFVVPDKTTWIRLAYDPCQIQEEDIQKLMALYCTCLEQSSESLDETVLVTLRRID
jgi:non-ribosomal peptide synthase protein (TIGR01720 family)